MSVLTGAITSGATVYAVSAIHLGRNISISEIYSRLWVSLGSILRALLVINFRALWLFGLAFAIAGPAEIGSIVLPLIGLVAGIAGIPVAIITYLTYALTVPVCAVERLPARQALLRSKFLTESSLGRIFLINLLAGAILAMVSQALKLPTFLFDHFGYHLTTIFPAGLWNNLAQFLAETLAGPVAAIAIVLLYYDQRVRKEAFDLQLMIESLAEPAMTKVSV
ncbi:MAG: hypothetical protein LAP21_06315 [Acidobacteriia bacterium]|nr:hypothetical protein [Terriglobia bacterium]